MSDEEAIEELKARYAAGELSDRNSRKGWTTS